MLSANVEFDISPAFTTTGTEKNDNDSKSGRTSIVTNEKRDVFSPTLIFGA